MYNIQKSIFDAVSMILSLDSVSSCKLHAACNTNVLFALVTQITISNSSSTIITNTLHILSTFYSKCVFQSEQLSGNCFNGCLKRNLFCYLFSVKWFWIKHKQLHECSLKSSQAKTTEHWQYRISQGYEKSNHPRLFTCFYNIV